MLRRLIRPGHDRIQSARDLLHHSATSGNSAGSRDRRGSRDRCKSGTLRHVLPGEQFAFQGVFVRVPLYDIEIGESGNSPVNAMREDSSSLIVTSLRCAPASALALRGKKKSLHT
ncbi:hypothetical protein THAOC_14160 [Thalassiosira oceanica]|uniref:Uncharacterized protein n=1 Tax=Thalassiosira oceanica TaxID=159749 RepID=K0T3S2_THAOC|nr:hypothetical protein THAOC_14160 [Thalassiosira oceanica]|eukprot:EJK65042.1 hypothetical protein THAOC_14160 [Thalassiosira oceanica]